MNPFRSLAVVLFVTLVLPLAAARGAEPLLKPNDVVALVGGEDMVAESETGFLEVLLQRALPEQRLKFRCLAWEGDTVFEQPRELNYPTIEAQLDEVGATVVIMQFGQMESLAGSSKLPEFIKAYEKLIERVSAGGKRRVIVLPPPVLLGANGSAKKPDSSREDYSKAIAQLTGPSDLRIYPGANPAAIRGLGPFTKISHDGVHASAFDLLGNTAHFVSWLTGGKLPELPKGLVTDPTSRRKGDELTTAIRAKNLLWFHYYRPQNWAFLNGDRTEQPSSRDHKDPSKRWFPEEMKQFLSLVEAKEKEIWTMVAKAGGNGKPANQTN